MVSIWWKRLIQNQSRYYHLIVSDRAKVKHFILCETFITFAWIKSRKESVKLTLVSIEKWIIYNFGKIESFNTAFHREETIFLPKRVENPIKRLITWSEESKSSPEGHKEGLISQTDSWQLLMNHHFPIWNVTQEVFHKNIDKKWQIRIEEKENLCRNKTENRKREKL